MEAQKFAGYFCKDQSRTERTLFQADPLKNRLFYAAYTEAGKTSFRAAVGGDAHNASKIVNLTQKYQILDFETLGSVCERYPVMSDNSLHTLEDVILIVVIILLLISNSVICYILTRKHMRTPTNFILLIIAISELLTGLFPLPNYLARTITGKVMWWKNEYDDILFRNLTKVLTIKGASYYQTSSNYFVSLMIWLMESNLPTLAHAASIWLTVSLAAQRLIYITWPAHAPRWCSVKSSQIACLISWIIVFLINSPLFTTQFILMKPIIYLPEMENNFDNNTKILNCIRNEVDLVKQLDNMNGQVMKCNNNENLMNFYVILRILFMHIIPCTLLIILTAFLLVGMRRMSKRRQRLFSDSRAVAKQVEFRRTSNQTPSDNKQTIQVYKPNGEKQKTSNCFSRKNRQPSTNASSFSVNTNPNTANPNSTSKMLLVILFIFLTIQLTNAIYMVVYTFVRSYEAHLLTLQKSRNEDEKPNPSGSSTMKLSYARFACNVSVLISYLANFFIYWSMSIQFRTTLYIMCGKSTNVNYQFPNSRRLSRPDGPSGNNCSTNPSQKNLADCKIEPGTNYYSDKNHIHPEDFVVHRQINGNGNSPISPQNIKGYCTVTDL